MTSNDTSTLSDLLDQLKFQLAKPVEFERPDPKSTASKVRRLTAAAASFNILAVADLGGRPGPERQRGLVEQVVAAACQTFAGQDPHPAVFDKAAMMLRGIIQGHPFMDGNKRTGFLVAIFYLDRVGYKLRPDRSQSEIVSFCRGVCAGEIRNLERRAAALRAWTIPRRMEAE